ncbi:MAG: hypothetical protein DHS20C18_17270 [Saprospiraceae bacterium]|nr:MAG: hypothetical protein DHS20C18_17270 [Saprospiraceae bacterium]
MKDYLLKKLHHNNGPQLPAKEIWHDLPVITDFTYPWRQEVAPPTTFRAFYTDDHLFFRFTAEDMLIEQKIETDMFRPVVDSDRVEIFFRVDAKMQPYYCLEMDARGRVLDYVAHYHRKFDYDWEWPVEQLWIEAELTQNAYQVTGSISLASLRQLGIWHSQKIEVGLYRAQYLFDANGQQREVKWISWCQPDSPHPDFHIPSSFGLFRYD